MNPSELASTEWVDVCRVDRLLPDRGVSALVGNEQVAIFRLGATGEVLAISNYDPFSRAFVLSRGIVGTKGDVVKVASPVYKQTFDLRTGACFEKPGVRVPIYPARVVDCVVQVRPSALPARMAASEGVDLFRGPESTFAGATSTARPHRGGALAGFRVGICEFRERDRLADLLEQKGASVVSCPLVKAVDAEDSSAVETWIREVVAGQMETLVFYTGEGVRRILTAADRLGVLTAMAAALSRAQTVTRGPKPARALRDAGILPSHPVDDPTSAGVLDALRDLGVGRSPIGIQLYPRPSTRRFVQRLKSAGFDVRGVWPYAYASAAEEPTLRAFATRLAAGQIDVIVFTSRAQIDALYEAAASFGLRPTIEAGLLRSRIAAIGPVVAATLRSRGLRPSIVPFDFFFMKSLVRDIVAASAAPSAA